jgi:hypothetical protein
VQNDEQAIRQLVTSWLEASKAGDTEKVLSLMADDVVFLVTGQPPMDARGDTSYTSGGIRRRSLPWHQMVKNDCLVGGASYPSWRRKAPACWRHIVHRAAGVSPFITGRDE